MISDLASVSFLPSNDGGLSAPLATPRRSLLLRVPGLEHDEPVLLGVLVSTDGDTSIGPGNEFPCVRFDFWDEVKCHLATRTFTNRTTAALGGVRV